jgi:hypothetical protein
MRDPDSDEELPQPARPSPMIANDLAREVSNAVTLLSQSVAQVGQVYVRLLMESENRAAQLGVALQASEETAYRWKTMYEAQQSSVAAMNEVRNLSMKMLEEEQAAHRKTKEELAATRAAERPA